MLLWTTITKMKLRMLSDILMDVTLMDFKSWSSLLEWVELADPQDSSRVNPPKDPSTELSSLTFPEI